jgi:phage terminase large subunit-like protein
VALSGSPNANDGARTTFQHFDETHRMELPRLVAAHETMLANIPKRVLDDPWSLETTTAGRPGAGSVAEKTHREAQAIAKGEIKDPTSSTSTARPGPGTT